MNLSYVTHMTKGFLVSVIMIWSVRRQNYRKEHFKSSPYFYSKKYLKHFITELVEVELKVKVKLKVAIMIPPTLRPSATWGSRGWTVTRGGLEGYFWVTGQGRNPRPGLGSLPWPAPFWAPFTRAPSRRPSHARSARWSTAESPRLLWAT